MPVESPNHMHLHKLKPKIGEKGLALKQLEQSFKPGGLKVRGFLSELNRMGKPTVTRFKMITGIEKIAAHLKKKISQYASVK